jgi:aspartate racemase
VSGRKKTIGVLGGMGPFATVAFYRLLVELTPASKDWDHIRVVIDSNPHIPSRSRHHLYGEASPVPGMIDSCRRLSGYPVDFIVIPCNSASRFLDQVQNFVPVPILNIMEITVDAVAQAVPPGSTVGVFGGVITYDCKTYERFLAEKSLVYHHHSPAVQRKVESIIEKIKINSPKKVAEQEFSELLSQATAENRLDALVLGCTEFGCLSELDSPIPMIDSSLELARQAVALALK